MWKLAQSGMHPNTCSVEKKKDIPICRKTVQSYNILFCDEFLRMTSEKHLKISVITFHTKILQIENMRYLPQYEEYYFCKFCSRSTPVV